MSQLVLPLRSSIIICTWNRPDDLIACVCSIIAQDVFPYELIIIDASSSPEILEQNHATISALVAKTDIRLVYQVTLRASLPFQRNLGIESATGDILFFLDDDIILSRDFHRVMTNLYARFWDTDLGGIQGNALELEVEPRTSQIFRSIFLPERRESRSYHRMHSTGYGYMLPIPKTAGDVLQVEWMDGCVMSFKRKVCADFRFDESLEGYAASEDKDFTYRVSRRYRLLLALDAHVVHKRSAVARLTPAQVSEMSTVNRHYLFSKNMPQNARNQIAYGWAAFGFLLFAGYKAILFHDFGYVVGTLRGIRSILGGEMSNRFPTSQAEARAESRSASAFWISAQDSITSRE